MFVTTNLCQQDLFCILDSTMDSLISNLGVLIMLMIKSQEHAATHLQAAFIKLSQILWGTESKSNFTEKWKKGLG